MNIPDSNIITMHIGRGRDARCLRFRMETLTPQVASDFSTVSAHVNLYVDVREDREDRVVRDWHKMELLTGCQTEREYHPGSVISELEHRLSRMFNTKIPLYLPHNDAVTQRGEVMYQLVLNPVPDGTMAHHFPVAIRRTLNRIKEEREPQAGRRQGGR